MNMVDKKMNIKRIRLMEIINKSLKTKPASPLSFPKSLVTVHSVTSNLRKSILNSLGLGSLLGGTKKERLQIPLFLVTILFISHIHLLLRRLNVNEF